MEICHNIPQLPNQIDLFQLTAYLLYTVHVPVNLTSLETHMTRGLSIL